MDTDDRTSTRFSFYKTSWQN